LLNHEFFAEDLGLKLEMVTREDVLTGGKPSVTFRLRVPENNKRKKTTNENEAIQFEYSFEKDTPESVAADMVIVATVLFLALSVPKLISV
jgi:WNK lysine deficient protein kinase